MKFPTRENIDRWMFDYTEGNLSPEQETLLENYILNNPDLEVDLDAWQMATVSAEELVYAEKDKAYKKRRLLPYFIGAFSALLVISMLLWNYNQIQTNRQQQVAQSSSTSNKATKSVSTNVVGTENTTNSVLKSTTNNSEQNLVNDANDLASVNTTIQTNNPTDFAVNSLNQQTELNTGTNQTNNELDVVSSVNSNQAVSILNTVSNQNESKNSNSLSGTDRLKTNALNSFILDGYQVRAQDLITFESSDAVDANGLSVNTPKILSKIEKILSKDVAITNVPDHTYALPELSDVDVLFSNIGATSKARFYSVTRARWFGNEQQQKLSQQFSFDSYSRATKSAFGLQANYDYFGNGVIQNWDVALLFSPKIALSRNITLEPAMRFKMGNKLLDQSKLTNNSQVEFETGATQTFNFDENRAIGSRLLFRDLDAGLTINTSLFYIGFQSTNLLKHFDNIYSNADSTNNQRASGTTSLIAGTQYISRNEKFVFSPYVYAQFRDQNKDLYAGFSMKMAGLMIGASYGNNQAITGLIGLSTNRFSLFGQTTLAHSNSLNTDVLTHQLTLRFNSSTSRKARRYITL
jgi:cytoskeletal protein RodZ